MDWRAARFNWNHARAFFVAAEEGSFSAAGRALNTAQPTIGRQVAALEEELGVALFEPSDEMERKLAASTAWKCWAIACGSAVSPGAIPFKSNDFGAKATAPVLPSGRI